MQGNFTEILDKNYIRSPRKNIVRSAVYQYENESTYNFVSIGDNEIELASYEENIINRGNSIDVCPDEVYQHNTVESAGLNTHYFINQTFQKVQSLIPEIKIGPIDLRISPSLKISYILADQKKVPPHIMYLTDNAFYDPFNRTISFLPHSKEAQKAGMDFVFWEVPMVASHEYGHHIFASIFHDLPEDGDSLCFNTRVEGISNIHVPGRQKEKQVVSNELRFVTINDVLSGLNEGFADLIAYYSLSDFERSLHGLKCLQVSRDVGSDTFINGAKKFFGPDALNSFFSITETENESLSSCESINYQDSHTLGAIFAHSVETYLNILGASKEQKLKVTLEWLKKMDQDYASNVSQTPQDFLETSFITLLRIAPRTLGKIFDVNHCDEVEEIYPRISLKMDECTKPLNDPLTLPALTNL